jgi:hypothetical protein
MFLTILTLFGDPSAHYNSNSYYNHHQSVIACISELLFPTCQMRVVRFYVSCPRPPSVPRRTRTATSGAKCPCRTSNICQNICQNICFEMPWWGSLEVKYFFFVSINLSILLSFLMVCLIHRPPWCF